MGMNFELVGTKREENEELETSKLLKGVRHLCESGITRVPRNYILPVPDRPAKERRIGGTKLKLPVVDLSRLLTSDRGEVLRTLAKACEEYGFFQVVNHGIDSGLISRMVDVGRRFFELPFEERRKYMSSDIRAPVRCGTSLNQVNDGVFFWRDFLKLNCHQIESVVQHCPSYPLDLRDEAVSYVKQVKSLFLVLVGAILETLGLDNEIVRKFDDGTNMMVINCFPACPEPNLTLGMPPHSDYGFLTLLLQDDVHGLQVQCKGEWVTVEPVPNSFVVNAGDHLEIFSNGRYKSVLHRVLVNSSRSRISIASLLSLPFDSVVSPSPELVNDENPRLYKDTDFASFLDFITSNETKRKNFLETRRLTKNKENVKTLINVNPPFDL